MSLTMLAGSVIAMNTARRHSLALASAFALATSALATQALASGPSARSDQAPSVAAYRPASPVSGWRLNKVISFRHRPVILVGIDAVTAKDAWAAGMTSSEYGTKPRPLLEHWDGRSWRQVALPAGTASHFGARDIFANVGALSATDVWAITFQGRYLWLHGTRSTFGALPGSKTGKLVVDQVKAFSPADVWAFGYMSLGSASSPTLAPYAARFDGSRWTTIPVPGRGVMGPVSAISPSNIWAATSVSGASTVLRWNGARWRPVPVQPTLPVRATAMLASSNTDVWIGGGAANSKSGTSEVAQHWNGKAWIGASPHSPATKQDYYLAGLAPDGTGNGFWALGGNILGPPRLWHHSRGGWSAPVPVPWQLYQLAAVPHTRSTWGIGWNADQTKAVIVLHGAVPR
jgi:hypothetical protein